MVGTPTDWGMYSVPSKSILQQRKDFYCLRRQKRESTAQWLNRIQKCIMCCGFPSFVEFLLIDRFICGLDATELKSFERGNKSWTLKQIQELLAERKNGLTKMNGGLTDEREQQCQTITALPDVVQTIWV